MRSLDQVRSHRSAHCDRLRLQDFCLAAYLSRPPHLLLRVPRQDRLDLDLKNESAEMLRKRAIASRTMASAFSSRRACVLTPFSSGTLIAHQSPTRWQRAVAVPHLLHQPRPSSSSNALKMACAVISLISRCRGTVTFVLPHCQTSCRPPCLTRRHALPCAAAAR